MVGYEKSGLTTTPLFCGKIIPGDEIMCTKRDIDDILKQLEES